MHFVMEKVDCICIREMFITRNVNVTSEMVLADLVNDLVSLRKPALLARLAAFGRRRRCSVRRANGSVGKVRGKAEQKWINTNSTCPWEQTPLQVGGKGHGHHDHLQSSTFQITGHQHKNIFCPSSALLVLTSSTLLYELWISFVGSFELSSLAYCTFPTLADGRVLRCVVRFELTCSVHSQQCKEGVRCHCA